MLDTIHNRERCLENIVHWMQSEFRHVLLVAADKKHELKQKKSTLIFVVALKALRQILSGLWAGHLGRMFLYANIKLLHKALAMYL